MKFLSVMLALAFSAKVVEAEALDCQLVQLDALCETDYCPPEENDGWRCVDEVGVDYALEGLPSNFIEDNKENLVSAVSVLSVSSGTKDRGNNGNAYGQNKIKINPGASVSVHARGLGNGNGNGNGNANGNANGNRNGNNRMLRQQQHQSRNLAVVLEGDPTFLVVHVTTGDGAPTKGITEIVDDVLGVDTDPVNLASQYTACSGGKLNYQPAVGAGITNGGVAITLSQNSTDVNRYTVHGWVDTYIADNHASWPNDFNHIMYVLPANVNFTGAAAYAYIGNYKSVYRDGYSTHLTVLMHETGHNLRMYHSGQGLEQLPSQQYLDHSCYMGNPLFRDDRPVMCFNAAKSWHTGWYTNGHQEVDVQVGWEGNLVGVDDFNNNEFDGSAGDRVLLKIPHATERSEDLYIMYNRAKGINAEVVQGGNKVVIVKGAIDPATGSITSTARQTWRVADLDVDSGRIFLTGYGVQELVIQVLEMTQEASGTKDFARVLISSEAYPTAAPTECPHNLIQIDLLTDNWPGETSWTLVDQSTGETLMSGSGYESQAASYSESMCVDSDGQFAFTIDDTFGDGICCGQGSGYYTVWYNNQVVQTGGDFGRTKTVVFPEASEPSALPSRTPTATPSKAPTISPSRSPTIWPSRSPSKGPTSSPTETASDSPTTSPSKAPTDLPSASPTEAPSKTPSASPSKVPTTSPSSSPSKGPTSSPSGFGSSSPSLSQSPTAAPTETSSNMPTSSPTGGPSMSPSKSPTGTPTTTPSKTPTGTPTKAPSDSPTSSPSKAPTSSPSKAPTEAPTGTPTKSPSDSPTKAPSASPTKLPTSAPSSSPTKSPTRSPSASPSKSMAPSLSQVPTSSSAPSTSDAPTISDMPSVSSAPSATPTISVAPSFSPTGQVCNLAKVNERCFNGSDCCSGSCTNGNPNRRVCLPGSNPTPSPVESPVSSPVESPVESPTGGDTCSKSVGDSCKKDVDCCPLTGLLCSGGSANQRKCYQD